MSSGALMLQSHVSGAYIFVSSSISTSMLSVEDILSFCHTIQDLSFIDLMLASRNTEFVIDVRASLIEVVHTLVVVQLLVTSADEKLKY